jgi:hypothetical protein
MAVDWLRGKRVHTIATEEEFFVGGSDVVLDADPEGDSDGVNGDFSYLYVNGPDAIEATS